MAKVVGGFASSHSPLMSLPGELWKLRAEADKHNRELITVPEGRHVTYEELLAQADPNIAKVVNVETFTRKEESIQRGLDELETRFGQSETDVAVMFGDDQSEYFFEDNYPTINLYGGESIKVLWTFVRRRRA